MYEFPGYREEPVDFEKIKGEIESAERLPNEPAELFLFRLYQIVHNNLPIQFRTPGMLSPYEMTAADLLFSREELRSVLDQKLKEIEEGGYFNDQKISHESVDVVEECISIRSQVVQKDRVNLTTPESSRETFNYTTNSRTFLNYKGFCNNGMISNFFLVDSPKTETEWSYVKNRIDDKEILLVGGGYSGFDLFFHDKLSPKKVTNIDPFLLPGDETLKKLGERYEARQLSAEDENLVQKLDKKFDEIWASFSVPLYSKYPEDIRRSIENMVDLLAKGGTVRISPLGVGHNERVEKSKHLIDDSMFESLIEVIEELKLREDLNVFFLKTTELHGGTLFIQKIK